MPFDIANYITALTPEKEKARRLAPTGLGFLRVRDGSEIDHEGAAQGLDGATITHPHVTALKTSR